MCKRKYELYLSFDHEMLSLAFSISYDQTKSRTFFLTYQLLFKNMFDERE